MTTEHFNATMELQQLLQKQKLRRRKTYCRSRLHKHRAEIVALLKSGASFRLVREWLKTKKHVKVSHTTVMRFAKQLPEWQEVEHAKLP